MRKIYWLFTALLLGCFIISCSSDDNNSSECYKLVGNGKGNKGYYLLIDNSVKKYVNKIFYVEKGTHDHYKTRMGECVDQRTIDDYFKNQE
ncbi:hypothetical protein HX063_05940 [Myroides odoratimimus]|uniref:hypothetical protein n=1 Tax=Myroides odoratimimus TaxID=76832 RepID=UPI00257508B2|nr:hypothetical protein [Myroides odoratimimus]MDM1494955.1 hypothetical protein [Myroides odoratimimus]